MVSHERQWVSQDSIKCSWMRSYQGGEEKMFEKNVTDRDKNVTDGDIKFWRDSPS
jgi:hypothetical protein